MKKNMILIAAPSGAGKSSFVQRICQEDRRLVDVITCTTRQPRVGEKQGQPYFFLTPEDFEKKINEGYFAEWAKVHTNLYGTPWDQLRQAWTQGLCVIMDIDVQGVETFKNKIPEAKSIFILPPSIDALRHRILGREGQAPADLDVRMRNAEIEMDRADSFDYQVTNDEFEQSFAEFKKIIDEILSLE